MKAEDILIVSGYFNLSKLYLFTGDNDDPNVAIPINASMEKEIIVIIGVKQNNYVSARK